MHNPSYNNRSPSILFALLIIMMGAVCISRSVLSVSILLFVTFCFLHAHIRSHIRNFFSTPLLWSMSLLFFIPLVTGLWSDDKKEWLEIMRIKLPLLLLPLAFAGPFTISKKQGEWLAFVFILLITAGTIWSMFHYAAHITAVQQAYLRSKTIITPLQNDHVRFSWLVSIAILLAAWKGWEKRTSSKTIALALWITGTWLVIFLHILAARTGLLSFYWMALAGLCWIIFYHRGFSYIGKKWVLSGIIACIIALPFMAYSLLPTFHNRVQYFLYERGYFRETHYLPGANDAVRIISMKAGWQVMNDYPLTGTGMGDVLSATKKWYAAHYPEMNAADQIYPGSEWLIYGVAGGWLAFLLFAGIVAVPFFLSLKMKPAWWLLNGTIVLGFVSDIGLEVQFGVFLYSFILLWWWKWMKPEKT